jgi:hypothetical protein
MALLVLFVALATAFRASAAEVDVWCGTQLAEIDPLLYGSGDEIDEELVPEDDLPALISQTGVPMLRMGGIWGEYYDWEGNGYEGVRYIDFVDTLIISQNVQTSMDDFLQMCEELEIEPVLTVNFQLNDPGKAARLVQYCNGDTTTAMGQVRAARGHPEPYDVEYWAVGNEPDITGMQLAAGEYTFTMYRHFGIPFEDWHWSDSSYATASDYAQLADAYADTMRASSPLPLQIATISLAGDLEWLEETIQVCGDQTDWIDAHYYPCGTWEQTPPDTSDYIAWLRSPDLGDMALEPWYSSMCDSITAYNEGTPIPLWIMEYNALVAYSDPVWWNYLDGLFVADCLGHLARAGCPAGGVYSIYEGAPGDPNNSFGMIRGDTLSLRATAWVIRLLSEKMTGTAVLAESDASGMGYGLEVHASLREDGKLCLIGVNKVLDLDYEAQIRLHGYVSSGYAAVWDITNNAPMQAPSNGTTGIEFQGGLWGSSTEFDYTFPAASVTCLLVHPEGSGTPGGSPDRIGIELQPVPMTGRLDIDLDIPVDAEVTLSLFDCVGRLRDVVFSGTLAAGSHSLQWDGSRLPAGTYLLQAAAGDLPPAVSKLVVR